MARTGKIARLPEHLRTELNERILANQPASKILPWLNDQLEVKQLLEEDFEGLSVNDENLHKWRIGGYAEWLTRRERVASIRELSNISIKLAEANGGAISEGAAAIAAGHILTTLESLDDLLRASSDQSDPSLPFVNSDPRARLETISTIVGDLTLAITRLRKGDSTNAQLKLNQDRLAQLDRQLALEREKFQRTTCELFIKWYDSEQARRIASSPASYADKVDQLGQQMWGDLWNLSDAKK